MTRKRKEPRTIAGKFKRDVAHLREVLPPLLPVRVYRRRLKNEDALGYTYLATTADDTPTHFVIAVDNRLSWDATWQVLIHEWAHALAWTDGHETVDDHGPEWALALSRVYQDSVMQ
jgi:hypothetical protein